ncbi:unnamed protein product [Staurois parvus]|uniref:Secreted protein n=1 Tax=Staurois parvus TaxID=386267 RepID=A0ABN9BM73_9NEOB|nr:unnamed protein product [Staurois parvus]
MTKFERTIVVVKSVYLAQSVNCSLPLAGNCTFLSLECTNHPKNITATRRVNGSNSLNVQYCGPK